MFANNSLADIRARVALSSHSSGLIDELRHAGYLR
jgi:hypothetical protein